MKQVRVIYSLLVVSLLLVLEVFIDMTYITKQMARIGLLLIGYIALISSFAIFIVTL